MKIGLLFAGQGAQYTGMGEDLYNHSPAAKEIMDLAGEEVKEWCFFGTKEMLRQTNITQPCIYTVTMAAYKALLEGLEKENVDIEIGGMAGFSLGEYAALTAAGVIDDIRTGMDIVVRRGTLMNQAGMDASGQPKGSMVAAFGERAGILACVEDAREGGILEGVNFNSPVQTVVAGDKNALERFKALAKERRIKAMQLSVGTAFHSSMMEPAAAELHEVLIAAKLNGPKGKVYSNATGKDMMEGFDGGDVGAYISQIMTNQAKSPVYWQEIIENMAADGITAFVEIGPGSTLSGLVKKTKPELLTMHVDNMESLGKTMEALKEETAEC